MADASAADLLSQIFMVPAGVFEGPAVIVNLIVPLLTTGVFFYMMLSRKVRIFHSGVVNIVLGICLSFFAIPAVAVSNPYATIAVTVFGIVTFMGDRITGWRIAIALGAAIAAWALASYATYLIAITV